MNPIMVNPSLNSSSAKASRILVILAFTALIISLQTTIPISSVETIQAAPIVALSIIQATDDIMDKVIGLAVGLFATAYLVPPAILALAGANLTGVDAGVVSIIQVVLPIMAGIALVLLFVRSVRK